MQRVMRTKTTFIEIEIAKETLLFGVGSGFGDGLGDGLGLGSGFGVGVGSGLGLGSGVELVVGGTGLVVVEVSWHNQIGQVISL
jgi:hypothetical protein